MCRPLGTPSFLPPPHHACPVRVSPSYRGSALPAVRCAFVSFSTNTEQMTGLSRTSSDMQQANGIMLNSGVKGQRQCSRLHSIDAQHESKAPAAALPTELIHPSGLVHLVDAGPGLACISHSPTMACARQQIPHFHLLVPTNTPNPAVTINALLPAQQTGYWIRQTIPLSARTAASTTRPRTATAPKKRATWEPRAQVENIPGPHARPRVHDATQPLHATPHSSLLRSTHRPSRPRPPAILRPQMCRARAAWEGGFSVNGG